VASLDEAFAKLAGDEARRLARRSREVGAYLRDQRDAGFMRIFNAVTQKAWDEDAARRTRARFRGHRSFKAFEVRMARVIVPRLMRDTQRAKRDFYAARYKGIVGLWAKRGIALPRITRGGIRRTESLLVQGLSEREAFAEYARELVKRLPALCALSLRRAATYPEFQAMFKRAASDSWSGFAARIRTHFENACIQAATQAAYDLAPKPERIRAA